MLSTRELASLAKATSEIVKEALEPALARIAELEAREARVIGIIEEYVRPINDAMEAMPKAILDEIPKPSDGKDGATIEELMPEIRSAVQLAVADIPAPKDGKDGTSVTVKDVLPDLIARLDKHISEMPIPKDGEDGESVTLADIEPIIESMHSRWELNFERRAIEKLDKAIDRIPIPKDGSDGSDADEDSIVKTVLERLGPGGVDKGEIAEVCADLVSKAVADIPIPKDGKDAPETTPEQVFTAVRAYIDQNPIPVPKDGKDADPVSEKQLSEAVAAHLKDNPIPIPKDGESVTDEQVQKAVDVYISKHPPRDGDSVTVDDVMPTLRSELQKAIDDMPTPQDGASVTIEDILPALQEQAQTAIDSLPVPKDGTSVTLDDIKPLIESKCAEWALDWEKRGQVSLQKLADMMPKAKDGRDAFRLEDVELSLGDDGRTVTFAFMAGDERIERSIKGQWPIYREVWTKETGYDTGNCVTFDGSTWMALKPSNGSRPGQFNSAWKLSVKKGRNGKST